ncbi:hypothetical protein ZWY2020_029895, partial [Hordeum vulgare]
PILVRELSCPKEIEIPKFQNLCSIHTIFPCLEDNFLHLDYLSHIEIPYIFQARRMAWNRQTIWLVSTKVVNGLDQHCAQRADPNVPA